MMKKIKINQLILSFGLGIVALGSVLNMLPAYAASCGGVTTSIISCSQTGVCDDKSNAFEGTDPQRDDAAAKAYQSKYGHVYGTCVDGTKPSQNATTTGIWGLLLLVINILTAGIGIVAVGGIIYGSILFASAGGSADQVKKARSIITNVVIGIIAYALMWSFLNFIIPGGAF